VFCNESDQNIFITMSFSILDKSAAIFCHLVAAWAPDVFRNFNLAKNNKTANCSTPAKAREK
jgi:hypothetical protein